jgi:hypothetical protein
MYFSSMAAGYFLALVASLVSRGEVNLLSGSGPFGICLLDALAREGTEFLAPADGTERKYDGWSHGLGLSGAAELLAAIVCPLLWFVTGIDALDVGEVGLIWLKTAGWVVTDDSGEGRGTARAARRGHLFTFE